MSDSRPFPLRSLPRVFVPGADGEAGSIELPSEEVEKLRRVLRLPEGSPIAVLPNDGTLIRCEFRARKAWPIETCLGPAEIKPHLTLAQALPKADRLETVIRMGTELGVQRFVLFPAERSVVRWERAKLEDRMRRLASIAREASEQCFRARLPEIVALSDLSEVLEAYPHAVVLSESEGESAHLTRGADDVCLVVGPEGGWAPRELPLLQGRSVTLGANVLRTDTAGIAAAALLLLPLA